MSKLILEEETYKVIGACIKVHKNLGCKFTEGVYLEAVMKELTLAEIPFEYKKELPIFYNGSELNHCFIADIVCFDKIIVEVKAVNSLNQNIIQEGLNYLKSTNLEVELLMNFSEKTLKWKRFVNTKQHN